MIIEVLTTNAIYETFNTKDQEHRHHSVPATTRRRQRILSSTAVFTKT